jgi:hypothetical protein
VDTRGGGVDRRLADRELNAADTPVTDAEELLPVGGHHQVDVVGAKAERPECGTDVLRAVDGQIDAARPAVFVAVPLDRLTHGRVVHDRQQLGEVVAEQPEVEDLIAVVELLQVHVLGHVVRLGPQLLPCPSRLELQGQHPGRQHPDQAVPFPLLLGEGDTLVARRVREQRTATRSPAPVDHGISSRRPRRLPSGLVRHLAPRYPSDPDTRDGRRREAGGDDAVRQGRTPRRRWAGDPPLDMQWYGWITWPCR